MGLGMGMGRSGMEFRVYAVWEEDVVEWKA